MPQPDPTTRKGINQRRSQRLLLRVQIVAERRVGQASTQSEPTETLAVNAHGALILLAPPVEDTEQLLIRNPRTSEEQLCRVVHQGLTEAGRLHVGVEFLTPAPNFWRVSFPPEDWATSIRESRPGSKE